MKRVALSALFLVAALSGCSAVAPFATFPAAAQKGEPQGERVAICYSPLASGKTEVEKAAQGECPANTRAIRVASDWRLNYCPLLLPARVTFTCAARK